MAVIGGGPAGMSAAGKAASLGADVTLFERNNLLGMKLGITGKGRCNLTNNCTSDIFMKNMTKNGKFMFSAINSFSSADTMELFESLGVPLKTERGNRVFPVSDKAHDIVMALKKYVLENGAHIVNERVTELIPEGSDEKKIGFVVTDRKKYAFDAVILCTGGLSYPSTGSDGDGYRLAKKLGHTVISPIPSLVGLTSKDEVCASLQGLALKNVGVSFFDTKTGKKIYEDFGELLFTHFGVSGPTVLSASAHLRPMEKERYSLHIDLKPALDIEKLDRRIISDIEKYKNKDMANALSELLPSSMIKPMLKRAGIPETKKANSLTQKERRTLLSLLKDFSIIIDGTRPIEEAIVTSGGIATNEISPNTMQSKKWENLYFAGEIIDVDAYTGGFNLQIAFSTAMKAANSAVNKLNKEV
ncbi:MAG: NAD(P)/FAD-dependent oxidoreductase [Eubacteriales bacterium]